MFQMGFQWKLPLKDGRKRGDWKEGRKERGREGRKNREGGDKWTAGRVRGENEGKNVFKEGGCTG